MILSQVSWVQDRYRDSDPNQSGHEVYQSKPSLQQGFCPALQNLEKLQKA